MPDDEYFYGVGNEPSEYELMLEQKRQERVLKQQIRQYGDDAMRVDPRLASDSGSIPTEEFQRSYQMRIPGVKHAKPEEKDPLKSLMKAMRLDQNTGTKKNRTPGKENKVDGTDFDEANGRPKRGRTVGEPTEKFPLYAR
jgi:hypothetical protein